MNQPAINLTELPVVNPITAVPGTSPLGFCRDSSNRLVYNTGTAFEPVGAFRPITTANGFAGIATLVAGTVTVANTKVATGDYVKLFRQTAGGTLGDLSVGAIVDATSFVINSSSALDTSTIFWELARPS